MSVKKWLNQNIVIVVLVLLCIGFGLASPVFFTVKNITNILSQMCINALLASGLVYVIILGGIDISVGSVVGLSGVLSAWIGLHFFPNMNVVEGVLLLLVSGLAVGTVIGAINGIMIAKFKVVPMIATLAMLSIARGAAYIVSDGQPVYGLPNSFAFLGAGRIIKTENSPNGIIPVIVIFTAVIVVIMHILLSKTVFGRHVYACGSNANVAHLSGISVPKITFICHVLCGITAALGGIAMASKLQNGQPAGGEAYEMYAIASTVLGGTSLAGGSGSVGRAMFGAAVIAVINNGMNLMQINSYWQKVVIGAIILMAVVLDMAQQGKTNKH
ncbi:ABC transporter permease [Suipraeoptans intestinalis]|uniref:ABC transporter permease n=1 Tax=Suipraeoptans intestinalis TaxID=2606628 RepID=A0A6N7V6E6_9FIRM|nr:ABC transporter permease [Suipraeoptans intestinalis]MDD7770195.1 ABC transporter permease [Suipraeoptans intestinalis]MDY3122654.1 ABC transporter permease [Suipraeoptans intestinalis]MSR94772.1 ABC transporter permease [Suipraeoptans intestinalis]